MLAHACCVSNAFRSLCINLLTPHETLSLHRYSGTAVNFPIQCQCLSTNTSVMAGLVLPRPPALDAARAVEPAAENLPLVPALEPELARYSLERLVRYSTGNFRNVLL